MARITLAPVQHDLARPASLCRGLRTPVALALGAVVGLATAPAEPAVWRLGPDGGRARSIVVDATSPGRVWAASDGGVFTSADRGEHWVRAGLSDRRVQALVLLPTATPTLLAGTDAGIFRRSGSGWEPSRIGLCNEETGTCESVVQLVAEPGSTLYAYGLLGSGAIVHSSDGGRRWNQLTFPSSESVTAIAASKGTSPILLAASPGAGLWRSVSRGASWADVSSGLTVVQGGTPHRSRPYAVAFDAARPLAAYATGSLGAFRSLDGGLTWTNLAAPAPRWGNFISLGIDPGRPGVLFLGELNGGVHRSDDDGATWEEILDGLRCTPADSFVAEYPSFAFEGGSAGRTWALSPDDGLRRSDDGGHTWVRAAAGMIDAMLTSIAVDPIDEWTMFVADARGVLLKTANRGGSWTELTTGYEGGCPFGIGLVPHRPRVAGIHPLDRRFILASLDGYGMRSSDGGETWSTTAFGDLDPVAFEHFDARRAFYAHDVTVYRTVDGGATWPRRGTAPAPVVALATTPANDAVIAAAITDLSAVAVSRNGAFTFDIPTVPPPNTRGHAVAIDAKNPDVIYVAGDGGLARSTDGGFVWTPVNAGLPTTCTTDPVGVVTCDGGPWVLAGGPAEGTHLGRRAPRPVSQYRQRDHLDRGRRGARGPVGQLARLRPRRPRPLRRHRERECRRARVGRPAPPAASQQQVAGLPAVDTRTPGCYNWRR